MSCAEWHNRIDAYVDGELTPADTAAFRAHTKNCAECAALALSATGSKAVIRQAGMRYSASPELRARVFASIKAETQPAIVAVQKHRSGVGEYFSGMWPRWAVAVAAVLLIAAGLFVTSNRRQESKSLGEFADLHVANLASANPVEVVSTDRHTVKPWFQGRIPFTFALPELQGSPFTLVGGRVAYFHQEPGAHLVFRYERHFISVFIFRDTSQLELPVSAYQSQSSSFTLRTWTQGDLRYVAISDAGAGTIQQLVDLLRGAQ